MRAVAATMLAVALGAWLTLADLEKLGSSDSPDETRYAVVGVAGIVLLIAIAGGHAIWLVAVATPAFAFVYEKWLWSEPAGIPGGMDGIAYMPTSVIFVLPIAVPLTALLHGFWTRTKRLISAPEH